MGFLKFLFPICSFCRFRLFNVSVYQPLANNQQILKNKIMHVDWGKVADEATPQSAINGAQSAKLSDELPPKCKNCTLEEVALLRIVQKNPSAIQKEIAAEIGKSERTVKSITIALQEKNILRRVNGKRNGYWEFIDDSIQQGSNIDKK